MSYLARLTAQLAAGVQGLPQEMLARQAAWLCAAQNADAGFSGRSGPSDVYYTSFGLRTLVLVGALDEARAQSAARFLRGWLQEKSAAARGAEVDDPGQARVERPTAGIPMPELASLVFSAASIEAVLGSEAARELAELDLAGLAAARLEALRRSDGGFAGTDRSRSSSTYHTFLAVVCCRQLEIPLARPEAIVELVRARQRPDGGFAETASARLSGTNPSAAAVAVLRALEALDGAAAHQAAGFLAGMQAPDGGWRAHGRIPLADLLSTFSALVALRDLESSDAVDTAAAARFVTAMECPGGGFRGVAIEEVADVEYTFYGLGSLALLRTQATPERSEPSET